MKRKLLILTSTFPRWAGDTDPPFIFELSKRLACDFDIIIHAPHYPNSKTFEQIDGIRVHRFRYFVESFEKLAGSQGILPTLNRKKIYYLLLPFFLVSQFFSLLWFVCRNRPDIIHAHWLIPQGFAAVIIKIIFAIPVVVTAHGGDVFGLQHSIFKRVKRFIVRKADKITVVSAALRNAIYQDGADVSIPVIPMGVDAGMFLPDRSHDDIRKKYDIQGELILFVGRLSEKKGVRYLVDAMPRVLREFPAAKLLIVGSGELDGELAAQARNSPVLREHIVFAGGMPNNKLPAYYANADIFVGPSVKAKGGDTEGFGLTFVEAALSGCLLIGSDVGGISEIIEDRKTGFLVPEKNSQAIAEKIIYGLTNKKEVAEIRKNARLKCVEKFDWGVIAKQYAELLSSVV